MQCIILIIRRPGHPSFKRRGKYASLFSIEESLVWKVRLLIFQKKTLKSKICGSL